MIPTGSQRLPVEATPGADKGSVGQVLPSFDRFVEISRGGDDRNRKTPSTSYANFAVPSSVNPRNMAFGETRSDGAPG